MLIYYIIGFGGLAVVIVWLTLRTVATFFSVNWEYDFKKRAKSRNMSILCLLGSIVVYCCVIVLLATILGALCNG